MESKDQNLGRSLDYEKLKKDFYSDQNNQKFKYDIGSPFINDRIDRANPLSRVLHNNQWFMSGYIVSRITTDKRKIYSQIVRIYRGSCDLYHVSLVDLLIRPGFIPSQNQFHARHYEIGQAKELLVPLSNLKFVDYTPNIDGYFNPINMPSDQIEIEYLRDLKGKVDEQRNFEKNLK